MIQNFLRHCYAKFFPKPNGEDYTIKEIVIKSLVWTALLSFLVWRVILLFNYYNN